MDKVLCVYVLEDGFGGGNRDVSCNNVCAGNGEVGSDAVCNGGVDKESGVGVDGDKHE